MSGSPSSNPSRGSPVSQSSSASGSPPRHGVNAQTTDEKSGPLNIDKCCHILMTRVARMNFQRLRQCTVKLTDKAESESGELKVDIYVAQDLLAIGASLGDPYAMVRVLPMEPKVKMVTYCLKFKDTVKDGDNVLLRKVKSPEPVIIRPVYFQAPPGYPPTTNVLTFNWEEWRPFKISRKNLTNPAPETVTKIANTPEFEEAFKNMEKDFASDPCFYQGERTVPEPNVEQTKQKDEHSNKRARTDE